MAHPFSRRDLFQTSVGLYLATRAKLSAAPAPAAPAAAAPAKSLVGLVRGENRTANIKAALELIDADIRRKLVGKKSVIIKPNLVSTNRQLAATHADALRGIIDYLGPRWKGPIFIAESSAGETFDGYKAFKYDEVVRDFKSRDIKMVDLNDEGLYETVQLLDGDLHIQSCRLAKRLCDPDAFVISRAAAWPSASAIPTHSSSPQAC